MCFEYKEAIRLKHLAFREEDLCSTGGGFCLYGAVNALFVAAAGFQSGIAGVKTPPKPAKAQECA